MFKINLIPEVKQEQLRKKKINMTVTTIAIAVSSVLVGVIVVLSIFVGATTLKINSVEKDTKSVEESLVKYKDLEQTVLSLEKGLTDIKSLLGNNKTWSSFLLELEKTTPSDVRIVSLNITDGTNMTMSLEGKDVNSVDRFIKSFSTHLVNDQRVFSSVEVPGFTQDGAGIKFTAKLTINKGAL